MKLTIEGADFARAMKVAKDVSVARTTIPTLSSVLLEAGDGELRISATDMDRFVTVSAAAEIDKPGLALADCARLAAIAGVLPEGAQLTLSGGESRLSVVAGRSRWRLGLLDPDAWPAPGKVEAPAVKLDGKAFATQLGRVAHAMSSEETRYYLCGVFRLKYAEDAGAVLRAVATDGHRLARADRPWPDKAEPGALDGGVIVPRGAVADIRRWAEGAGEVEIAVSENLLRFTAGRIDYTTKLIANDFPDYQRVIPTDLPVSALFDAAALAGAMRRADITAATDDKIKSRALTIAARGGGIVIASANNEGEAGQATLDAEIDGDFGFFGVNGRYLRDTLSAMDADTVLIRPSGAGQGPVELTSPGDASHLHVIMPMRATAPANLEEEDQT